MTRALIFPGQGSQAVGMGKAVAEACAPARQLFEEVDEALGQALSRLMFEGPIEELTLTQNAQPALMAVSMAVLRVLADRGGFDIPTAASHVAGHSLGEYTALAAAGAIGVADAARLLKTRGLAMQKAVPVGQGAMAAILGIDLDTVEAVAEAAAQGNVCALANDNAPGQVVLSGDSAAIDRAIEIAKDKGARRTVRLAVSAPFHCSLMAPAAAAMKDALATIDMAPPVPHLVANVTASTVSAPADIKQRLVEQVTARVRWRECVTAMAADGVTQLVEIGAGKVLSGLNKRIDPSLESANIGTPDEVDAFLASL